MLTGILICIERKTARILISREMRMRLFERIINIVASVVADFKRGRVNSYERGAIVRDK